MLNTTSSRFPTVMRRIGVPLVGASAAAALLTISVGAGTGAFGLSLAGASFPSCLNVTPSVAVGHCQRVTPPYERPKTRVAPVPPARPIHHITLPAPFAVSPMSPGELARLRALGIPVQP